MEQAHCQDVSGESASKGRTKEGRKEKREEGRKEGKREREKEKFIDSISLKFFY